MRKQAVRPADRACQELWEKGDKQRIISKVLFRGNLLLVNIDEIAHRLKKIKGDAGREKDPHGDGLHRKPACVDQDIQTVDQRRSRLIEQQDQYQRENTAKETAAPPGICCTVFQLSGKKVGQNGCQKEQDPISDMQVHIEDIACQQQKNPTVLVRKRIVQKKDNWQKYGKGHGIK